MRQLTTYEIEHILLALTAADFPEESCLNHGEARTLAADLRAEVNRRERAAAEQNIQPGARAVQYASQSAVITRYETPMAAHGVKKPKAGPDGSGVKIDDVDALLMLVGDASDLIPEA